MCFLKTCSTGRLAGIDMKFELATAAFRDSLLARRPGETRLGERIGLPSENDVSKALSESMAGYVLVGIPEDIGVRANLGVGGAHTAWLPALKVLLNTQSNSFVDGSEMVLLGQFNFAEALRQSLNMSVDELRAQVEKIDAAVCSIVKEIVSAGKIPIVIGGGHNNAYPILRGSSEALNRPLNCINMDAHSDYRRVEGRHSGNGFRFARNGGYLDRYALPWLHEAYNSAGIVAEMEADPKINIRFAETGSGDASAFNASVSAAINFTKSSATGIELDLDCIAGILSSAATPTGISAEQARAFIRRCAEECDCAYLHLAEGATELRDGRKDPLTAKLMSYLVRDFIASRKAGGSGR
jgi:formiminoglutamase